jgi:hypothetical protein
MLHQMSNTKLLVLLSGTLVGGALLADTVRQDPPVAIATVPTTTTLLSDHSAFDTQSTDVAEDPSISSRYRHDTQQATAADIPPVSLEQDTTDTQGASLNETSSVLDDHQPVDTRASRVVEDEPTSHLTSEDQLPPAGGEISNPHLHKKYYQMERGPHIVDLQMELGMNYVDGIYGPRTHKSHVQALGGPEEAVWVWMNQRQWEWALENPHIEASLRRNWHYEEPPTLRDLVKAYFLPQDYDWAFAVAFCESSAHPDDTYNYAVSSANAMGAFQHLHKYWNVRRLKAGMEGWDIFSLEANTAVASWLYYTHGESHWDESRSCWGKQI